MPGFEIYETFLQVYPESLQNGFAPGQTISFGLRSSHATGKNVDRDASLATGACINGRQVDLRKQFFLRALIFQCCCAIILLSSQEET
jgi:hypothetical protein